MPRPQNLSSSVSMFIEDSRVAAVANASSNPLNPANFYTISSIRHTPNIKPVVTGSVTSEGGSDHCHRRPTSLSISDAVRESSFESTHRQGQQNCYSASPRVPREIIHKIRREGEEDEPVRMYSSTTTSSSSFCTRLPDSAGHNEPSPEVRSPRQETSGRRQRSRVSISVHPSAPWMKIHANTKSSTNGFSVSDGSYTFSQPITHAGSIADSDSGIGGVGGSHRNDDRSYTSVNLTLKSPTSSVAGSITQQLSDSNCEYSYSTEILSPGSNCSSSNSLLRVPALPGTSRHRNCRIHGQLGNSVTYSSYSSSRDGFESQLQIQIGPHGGKISASRRRNSNEQSGQSKGVDSQANTPSMHHAMSEELIAAQLERKNKLEIVLSSEKIRLAKLRNEVLSLRSRLQVTHSPDLERLRAVNKKLMMECEFMTEQVDMYNNATIPLGETSEEFYRDIYPGQDANALVRNSSEFGRWTRPGAPNRGTPPPRPPPPRILPIPNQNVAPSGEWCCTICTFRNHPDLSQCEQCQMIRVRPPVPPAGSPGHYR